MNDAQAKREWLLSLPDKNGRITPDDVVEAAKDPSSTGHKWFPWDDKAAAHQHRLDLARAMLSLRVTVRSAAGVAVSVPIFVRDPARPPSVQGYIATDKVVAGDYRVAVMDLELSRVEGLLSRVEDIAVAFDLVDDVREVLARVNSLRARVQEAGRAAA